MTRKEIKKQAEALTPAQRDLLAQLVTLSPKTHGVRSASGKALVRKGFAECDSELVTTRIFSNADGDHVQFHEPKGHWCREWHVTMEGVIAHEYLMGKV